MQLLRLARAGWPRHTARAGWPRHAARAGWPCHTQRGQDVGGTWAYHMLFLRREQESPLARNAPNLGLWPKVLFSKVTVGGLGNLNRRRMRRPCGDVLRLLQGGHGGDRMCGHGRPPRFYIDRVACRCSDHSASDGDSVAEPRIGQTAGAIGVVRFEPEAVGSCRKCIRGGARYVLLRVRRQSGGGGVGEQSYRQSNSRQNGQVVV